MGMIFMFMVLALIAIPIISGLTVLSGFGFGRFIHHEKTSLKVIALFCLIVPITVILFCLAILPDSPPVGLTIALVESLLFIASIGLASTPKEQRGRRRLFGSMLVVSLLGILAILGFIVYLIYELFNSAL